MMKGATKDHDPSLAASYPASPGDKMNWRSEAICCLYQVQTILGFVRGHPGKEDDSIVIHDDGRKMAWWPGRWPEW